MKHRNIPVLLDREHLQVSFFRQQQDIRVNSYLRVFAHELSNRAIVVLLKREQSLDYQFLLSQEFVRFNCSMLISTSRR